jgi:hypothetical protein
VADGVAGGVEQVEGAVGEVVDGAVVTDFEGVIEGEFDDVTVTVRVSVDAVDTCTMHIAE